MEREQPQTQQGKSNDEGEALSESIPIPYSENEVERGPVDAYELRCANCGNSHITRFTMEDGRHVIECNRCKNISCPHCGKILTKTPTKRLERTRCPKCGRLLT